MQIGTRIRKLRKRQGRTLEQIATRCDFTRSLLSKIENGRTVPPVATLTRIAKALGVSISALLDDPERQETVHTPADSIKSKAMVTTDSGYSFYTFAAERPDKLMQPFLFEVKKGQVKKHALTHTGEEFVYILKGTVKYRVGDTEYRLTEGDSLYFDAEAEHEVTPVTKTATYIGVFTEAAVPKKRS